MPNPLDNPVWNALCSHNRSLGWGEEDVKWFDPAVSPFAALREDSPVNLARLHALHPGKGVVLLWTSKPLPSGHLWKELNCIPGLQMVFEGATLPAIDTTSIVPLRDEHVPAMLELTALTKPGPFDVRTIEFGNYEGIFHDGILVAMTGQRFHIPGHVEVSAVCTHPDHLGKGYADLLVRSQVLQVLAQGETPYLHVRADNQRAIAVYERIGFGKRMPVFFYVLKK